MGNDILARGMAANNAANIATNTASLASIARHKHGFDEYGKFVKPSDFTPTLPCDFYRQSDGTLTHNMNFTSKYKGGTKIYVTALGNDTTGDGSIGTPYRTLKKAIEIAIAGVDAKYEIITSVTVFAHLEITFTQTVTNKTIAFISTATNKTCITEGLTFTWAEDGTGTYKTTRATVRSATDNLNRDTYNMPVPMLNVATLAACQSTAGTWYTDATYLWVHRIDGILPTFENTLVVVGYDTFLPKIEDGGVIYFENFIFTGCKTPESALYIKNLNALPKGEVCLNNCGFVGRKYTSSASGLSIDGVKDTYVFDCISAYNQLDGFNYHFTGVAAENARDCFVLEYNCRAYDNGLVYGNGISNASSAHETVNVLRLNTIGTRCNGPIIVDVTGCYSICVDCQASNPVAAGIEGVGQAFYFRSDNAGEGLGKTYLINCKAEDCDTALLVDTASHTTFVSAFDYEGIIDNDGTLINL